MDSDMVGLSILVANGIWAKSQSEQICKVRRMSHGERLLQ